MRTIWKYELEITSQPRELRLPQHAEIVRVGMQGDVLCLWAIVDPDNGYRTRTFCVVGTGHEVPLDSSHIGTCDHGPLVWHVLEL